jgi:uncharacterized protein YndB with AHSA1/START domain
MTVTDVRKDVNKLTLTITAKFDAPAKRLWQIWADPRQLERWWGPPTYPATVVDHDLRPGGTVTYFMTGPEGDTHHGWWTIQSVDEPTALDFEDGFADETGTPNPQMPTTVVHVSLHAVADDATEMVVTSRFASAEAMEQLVAMGMIEGAIAAASQIPQLLAA